MPVPQHEPPALFQPIKLGRLLLKHRVVLAPLTRFRATKSHVPIIPLMKEYYAQRASTPGTLLISEGTFISPGAGGYNNVPGIWNDEQINAWREIVDAVHAQGSYIFLQLWAVGRGAEPSVLSLEPTGPHPYVAPSPIPLTPRSTPTPTPHELTIREIHEYIYSFFPLAAKNAVHLAGFDGVEIHAANGFLVDQFLHESSNVRNDLYGGACVEGRSRFGLEVVKVVVDAVGEDRTAIRLSPFNTLRDMALQDTPSQYTHFVSSLKRAHPNLAYLHLIEPRVSGTATRPEAEVSSHESLEFLRELWYPKPLIIAGGYSSKKSACEAVKKFDGTLVAFGRLFISNPDLPLRLQWDLPLTPYNRSTFYFMGDSDAEGRERGYIDYPFAVKDSYQRIISLNSKESHSYIRSSGIN